MSRPNRFLIFYTALNKPDSDYQNQRVEAHYISRDHANKRLKTLRVSRTIDQSSFKVFEYLSDSFSWPPSGISARFVVKGKILELQNLRNML